MAEIALHQIVSPEMLQGVIGAEQPERPQHQEAEGAKASDAAPEFDRPGDDLNARGSWNDILRPHGWQPFRTASDKVEWTRPGKDDGGLGVMTHWRHDALVPPLDGVQVDALARLVEIPHPERTHGQDHRKPTDVIADVVECDRSLAR